MDIFRDFLSNRTQKVKIGQYISTDSEISYGVPQGSILGPSLFLVYINDLCNMTIKDAKLFTYADDTAVIFRGESWPKVYASAEMGLNKIMTWLNDNMLTLNISKTKHITFTIRGTIPTTLDLNIRAHTCKDSIDCCCQCIEKVTEFKYLGTTLDDRLNWLPHINQITSRVRKLIWTFKKLRQIINADLLKTTYKTLCQSVISYCIAVWGGAYKSHLIGLERAQRSVLKVLLFKPYRFPTVDLFKESEVLSVRQLYLHNIIMYRHSRTPFTPPSNKRRQDKVCNIIKFRTKFTNTQYCFMASYLYNKINKRLHFHPLSKIKCKMKLSAWLLTLDYSETENILQIDS